MEQPLVLSHLILSTMPLPSYQTNYPTLQFGCVMEQPLSLLSYIFDLINYASLILLNKLSILFHPIIVWPCGRYYKVQGWAHVQHVFTTPIRHFPIWLPFHTLSLTLIG